MRIAIVASNYSAINKDVARGPEMFVYTLLYELAKKKPAGLEIVAYASGDSDLPVKIESISPISSLEDKNIEAKHYKAFELALYSKAFSAQDRFDLYHINTGDEKIILPFSPFVKKPILITLHSRLESEGTKKIYQIFSNTPHVYFVSISNSQRKPLPFLNFIKTIYHGIDLNEFIFEEKSDDYVLWIGRGIPEKGLDVGLGVCKNIPARKANFLIAPREEHMPWLNQLLKQKSENVKIDFELSRRLVIEKYQKAKLFLFPIKWEEPFGLVMVESMACGTPIVAYALGSVPEVVKDGKTGFIVNSSPNDVRGDWIVKKTGIEGLCEAVEKIYSMPEQQYKQMRRNCRAHVEKNFTVERMVNDYEKVYEEILNKT
jgi:glycosyltransferase involved in cell wall biosynthesis